MQQLIGIITSIKTLPTVKVEVTRRWAHRLYHKTMTKKKSYLAHCQIAVKLGQKVVLTPTRPMSKLKRWQVAKVVAV